MPHQSLRFRPSVLRDTYAAHSTGIDPTATNPSRISGQAAVSGGTIFGATIFGGQKFVDTLGEFFPFEVRSAGDIVVNASNNHRSSLRFHNTELAGKDMAIWQVNPQQLFITPLSSVPTSASVVLSSREDLVRGFQAYLSSGIEDAEDVPQLAWFKGDGSGSRQFFVGGTLYGGSGITSVTEKSGALSFGLRLQPITLPAVADEWGIGWTNGIGRITPAWDSARIMGRWKTAGGDFALIFSTATTQFGGVAERALLDATGWLVGAVGAVGAPAYSWITDPDTGLFRPVANEIGVSTAGVERIRVNTVGLGIMGTNLMFLNDRPIRLRGSGDAFHELQWVSFLDGPRLAGSVAVGFYNTQDSRYMGWFERLLVDNETALVLSVRKAAAYFTQRVTIGAVDSGGVGFRLLRVAN